MKSRHSLFSISNYSLALLLMTGLLSSCQQDKLEKRTTTLYAYEVDVAAETYSAGVLRYMEASYFEGPKLISKTYYNNNQSIKGTEKYTYENDLDSLPETSTYYGPDDQILARYTFENKDGHQVQRNGYDGETDELLRQERFQYDIKGNKVKKMIFDSQDNLMQTFLFGHDEFGNEKSMTILDAQGNSVATESYEIKFVDEGNRWIEKWGFLNNDKFPKTFYKHMYK